MRVWALGAGLALAIGYRAMAESACPVSDGTSVDVFLAAALSARDRGDSDDALACLRRAYLLEQSPGLIHNMARLLEDLGRYREASEAYRRVVADAATDAALREADRARMLALELKLDRAWLKAEYPPTVRVSGGHPSGIETDERPGPTTLEVLEGDVLHLLRLTLPAGLRTELKLPVYSPATDAWIEPGVARLETLDGRAFGTSLDLVKRLRVSAGAYEVEWRTLGGELVREAFTVSPGQTWRPEGDREIAVTPWIAGGVAVALGVGSGVLFGMAAGDRAEIEGAARDDRGVITRLTFVEAVAIDERASERTTVAAILVGGAVASAAVGLLIAWLGADDAP